ncbi:hypothetical protein MPTK2_7g09030 [Marchantia polymorpha subsp. ruderalis]
MARKDWCRLSARSVVLTLLLQVPIFFTVLTILDFKSCKEAAIIFSGFEVDSSSSSRRGASSSSPISRKEDSYGSGARSLKPSSYAHHPFVLYSAYRKSMRTFYVVGIASVVLRERDRPVHYCEWQPSDASNNSTIVAEANLAYLSFDEHNMAYVPITVRCSFEGDAGRNRRGGVLRLNVSTGFDADPPHGGSKMIDVMAEDGGAVSIVRSQPRFKYAFCGPPMHGTIRAQWVLSWLVYHHHLWRGEAHFMFYNVGGLRENHRYLFQKFIDAGLLTITDTLDEDLYPAWWHNRLLFINDCLHRSRFLAEWVFFFDFDEYLYVSPPHSIQSLLAENEDKPWMTFGSLPTSISLCRAGSAPWEWTVEQMLWRDHEPSCVQSEDEADELQSPWMCLTHHGRRKYVVNPRKVTAAGVHRIGNPMQGGVDFNASVVRMHHYHGALSHWQMLCQDMVNSSLPLQELDRIPYYNRTVRDDAISITFREAKAFAAPLIPTGA